MSSYEVKKSSAVLGLFATAPYKKGERIIEYTGERITEAEANVRGGKYLFELNDQKMPFAEARSDGPAGAGVAIHGVLGS